MACYREWQGDFLPEVLKWNQGVSKQTEFSDLRGQARTQFTDCVGMHVGTQFCVPGFLGYRLFLKSRLTSQRRCLFAQYHSGGRRAKRTTDALVAVFRKLAHPCQASLRNAQLLTDIPQFPVKCGVLVALSLDEIGADLSLVGQFFLRPFAAAVRARSISSKALFFGGRVSILGAFQGVTQFLEFDRERLPTSYKKLALVLTEECR